MLPCHLFGFGFVALLHYFMEIVIILYIIFPFNAWICLSKLEKYDLEP